MLHFVSGINGGQSRSARSQIEGRGTFIAVIRKLSMVSFTGPRPVLSRARTIVCCYHNFVPCNVYQCCALKMLSDQSPRIHSHFSHVCGGFIDMRFLFCIEVRLRRGRGRFYKQFIAVLIIDKISFDVPVCPFIRRAFLVATYIGYIEWRPCTN